MAGRALSVVTLHEAGAALSGNYLKVKLAREREPNRLVEVNICGVAGDGVAEAGAELAPLTSPGVLPLLSRS
jgi:hypothetical protein